MALEDAKTVERLLKEAGAAAVPLKDPSLTKKINEATEHVTKKLDTTRN